MAQKAFGFLVLQLIFVLQGNPHSGLAGVQQRDSKLLADACTVHSPSPSLND